MIAAADKKLFLVVSALFPIVDPLGGAPIFLVLTREYPSETRMVLSRQIAIDSFFLLDRLLFHRHAYTRVFRDFAAGCASRRRAGRGFGRMGDAQAEATTMSPRRRTGRSIPQDPLRQAFYPLTLPLTVGPGSISMAITLGANAAHYHGIRFLAVAIAATVGSILVAVSVFLCYGFSDRLARVLGPTAMSVIMQLASFLLVCIGMQILWNGVRALLVSAPFSVS